MSFANLLSEHSIPLVSTPAKAITRRSVVTQTEGPHKHTAVQVSGCMQCLSLALVPEDSRDNGCVWCNQVKDLLSLVAELKEEVERLRSIREREREIDWWSPPCPPGGQDSRRRLHAQQRTPYPVASKQSEGT